VTWIKTRPRGSSKYEKVRRRSTHKNLSFFHDQSYNSAYGESGKVQQIQPGEDIWGRKSYNNTCDLWVKRGYLGHNAGKDVKVVASVLPKSQTIRSAQSACHTSPHTTYEARVEYVLTRRPAQASPTGLHGERLISSTHVELMHGDTRTDAFGHRALTAALDGDGPARRAECGDKDGIADDLPSVGSGSHSVGPVATGHRFQGRSVPVHELVAADSWSRRSRLECLDIGSSEFEQGQVGHVVGVHAGTVVAVAIVRGSDVVRLAIVVPGDDLEVSKVGRSLSEVENLFPSFVPQGFGFEQPVLGVGDLFTKVRED
jgi:hypothetical protein